MVTITITPYTRHSILKLQYIRDFVVDKDITTAIKLGLFGFLTIF